MSIKKLRSSDSLETIADEHVYAQAKALADTKAQDLAGEFNILIARADGARASQITCWRNELRAQAVVDYQDEELDNLVKAFGRDLFNSVGGDTSNATYRFYFKTNPTAVVKLALESELEKVANWPDKLAGETDPKLQAYAAKFTQAIADGTAAVKAKQAAELATLTQRAREISRLVDDSNALRGSIYGILTTRAAQQNLGKEWADRFFRHDSHPDKQAPQSEPAPAAAAGAK